eukprot:scaffold1418_cov352-Prasinococcus_capsulatus_cf.AAC.8
MLTRRQAECGAPTCRSCASQSPSETSKQASGALHGATPGSVGGAGAAASTLSFGIRDTRLLVRFLLLATRAMC